MDVEVDSPTDDVRAAIAQLQNPEVAKDIKPEPEEQGTELHAEPETKEDRARDEKGRFVKAPDEGDSKPDPKELPTKDVKEVQPAGPQAPAVKAPPSWSAEAKADWLKLPPAIQNAVLKREKEVSDGFASKSAELKRWQELEGIIAPRRDYYRRFGFQNDVQAINHLLTISDSLERDPAGTIGFLAKHYNVPIQGLNGAPLQAQQPQPQIQQQQPQDIAALVREQIGLANAQSEIEEFASNADYPHFQTVRPLMSHLLKSGQAKTLKDAYEQAVWANPELRTGLLESMQSQKAEQERARVEAKKRASNASLSGAPHGAAPSAKKPNGKANGNAFDDAVDDVRAAIASLS